MSPAKSTYLIILLLLQTFQDFAQTKTNSLLWEISGNGLLVPSYLYGTIHIMDREDFSIRKEIDSVFAVSEQVAFEIKMDDLSAIGKVQSWMVLPPDKKLSDFCSPDEYEKIKKYLKDSLDMDIEMFAGQKPFVLEQLMMMETMEGETASYEEYFLTKSITAHKPIKGLELVEDQLNLFDTIPYSEQIDWILEEIDSSGDYGELWMQLIDAYKIEDLTLISKLMKSTIEYKYESLLISGRNKNWIPVIENLIQLKSTFIAVGAGHLPGENGVLELLRKKGYSLKAI
ncbi:MAG: TraB/GumN family protein [Chitinophagales bacterium]